ncbi:WRKY DNA-binding protein 2 [Tasmannia lanceolata]|uniref:WRKY DNA-binding protein 2 n=1 Tax=Tasmannia lanceolata TaxID=3420 RepID=UPI004062E16D
MAGIDENIGLIGDWVPPNPSPRTFFSSLLGDDFSSRSLSEILAENGTEKQKVAVNLTDEKDEVEGGDSLSGSTMFSGHRSSSLAERMAARAGFNAPRLNTARVRPANLLSPQVLSPYVLSPGISPTTLLDSPVFLSNSLAQPSPTTGKFPFAQCNRRSLMSVSALPDKNKDHTFEDVATASFVFKPHVESGSSYFPSAANKVASASNHHQSLPSIEVSFQSENPSRAQYIEFAEVCSQNQQGFHSLGDFPNSSIEKEAIDKIVSNPKMADTVVINAEHSPPPDNQENGHEDQRGELPSMVVGTPSDDGYNWRKYGQKQVKGSEYPRSYYKCTYPNCQVKKKVERSHEGHITEIIYKGAHEHPQPLPNRRSAIGSSSHLPNDMDISERNGAHSGFDGEGGVWASSTQNGAVNAGADWMHDGMETASSASVPTELCDPSTPTLAQNGLESADAINVSSTMSNDDEDDRGTHGSVSLGYDDGGDESESKRRKVDTCVTEISGATRAIREPRVVVQTTSEVDILDDGYRWRKYGQKVVKGNPNPRSYYKCTNAGCTVRKHVERASNDLKSVITTYEGKHNHDVPAARNSSHVSSVPSSAPSATQAYTSQVHDDGMPRFDGSTFGLPAGRQQLVPSSNFSFGMMAGLGSSQRKLPVIPAAPHSYMGGQHKATNEMGFLMMPKGEPKEESMSRTATVSNGGAVYHQMMSRLPLGPQL